MKINEGTPNAHLHRRYVADSVHMKHLEYREEV